MKNYKITHKISKSINRKRIIQNGIANLKEFGYLNADEKNILKVPVFKTIFLNMLKDQYNVTDNIIINEVIQELITELENKKSLSIPELIDMKIPNTFIMSPTTIQEALILLKNAMEAIYTNNENKPDSLAEEIRDYLNKNIFNKE